MDADWPEVWEYRDKHLRATIEDWDASRVIKSTQGCEGDSQYNPHRFTRQNVRDIEIACVRDGIKIRDTASIRKFYMDARRFLGDDSVIVGVCCGQRTPFVFAEWGASGNIHGRPISTIALKHFRVSVTL